MKAAHKHIVILGPRQDAVLERFHSFCGDRGLSSVRVSDPRALPFVLTFGNATAVGARLRINGAEHSLADVGLFIRGAGHLMHTALSDPFAKGETFSALWALASQAPHIVNRPGRWGWDSSVAQQRYFGDQRLLPRSTSHTCRYLLERLSLLGPSYSQVDIASSATREQFSLHQGAAAESSAGAQAATAAERWPDGPVYRGRFIDAPHYLIEMCAGACSRIVLDETGAGLSAPSYGPLRELVLGFANDHALHNYAIVTVFIDGHARLAKLDTEPPPRWYDDHAPALFGALASLLLGPLQEAT